MLTDLSYYLYFKNISYHYWRLMLKNDSTSLIWQIISSQQYCGAGNKIWCITLKSVDLAFGDYRTLMSTMIMLIVACLHSAIEFIWGKLFGKWCFLRVRPDRSIFLSTATYQYPFERNC
mgnify:CR=1 FL=1